MRCPECQKGARMCPGGQGMMLGLPRDLKAYSCLDCRKVTIEGSDQWVDLSPNVYDSLLILARKVKGEKVAFERHKDDEWDDPAWTTIEIDGRVF